MEEVQVRRRVTLLVGAFISVLALVMTALPAHAATETMFGTQVPPGPDPDSGAVTVGTKFSTSVAGKVAGVRFYKFTQNTGKHTGGLYSSAGVRLASGTFTNETASGWQTLTFSSPVTVAAGTYTAAVYNPKGRYAVTPFDTWPKQSGSLTALQGLYKYGTALAFPTLTYHDENYWIDVNFDAGATPSPTPTPSETVTPTPTPTSTSTTTSPTGFPDASNTGIPAGTALTNYTGPCTITAPNTVIDAKTVDCDLVIQTSGVLITRSQINGKIDNAENNPLSWGFTVEDSNIDFGPWVGTAVGAQNFTVRRTEVTGGTRSAHCWITCLIEDSYFHGQLNDTGGTNHESAIRMGKGATLRHNTIACTANNYPPDAGCSAALTGYGDFATVENNLLENNFFSAKDSGYCTYGGATRGKPFPNANNIRFIGNRWDRSQVNQNGVPACGWWGPITSFDENAPGNVWTDNKYLDGEVIQPAN